MMPGAAYGVACLAARVAGLEWSPPAFRWVLCAGAALAVPYGHGATRTAAPLAPGPDSRAVLLSLSLGVPVAAAPGNGGSSFAIVGAHFGLWAVTRPQPAAQGSAPVCRQAGCSFMQVGVLVSLSLNWHCSSADSFITGRWWPSFLSLYTLHMVFILICTVCACCC